MSLFSARTRADFRAAYHAERYYPYLDYTARHPFALIRSLLDSWFDRFLEFDDPQWLRRFQSTTDSEHHGAFFELYCRAMLDAQGFEAWREVSVAAEASTRPEFLVLRNGTPSFALEATVATSQDFAGPGERRRNEIYDLLNKVDSPDFFVEPFVLHEGRTSPPTVRLRESLTAWLATQDPDLVTLSYIAGGHDALPTWTWRNGDWAIQFTAISKKVESRGKPGVRPVGITTYGGWVTGDPLQRALKSKATRYGRPDVPYVVAVDLIETHCGHAEIANALFGREAWKLRFGKDLMQPGSPTAGLWFAGDPVNTTVSAVLVATDLLSHTIASSTPVLWHNPWARHPVDPVLWQCPQMVPEGEKTLEYREGRTPIDMLGLPAGWPGWNHDRVRD